MLGKITIVFVIITSIICIYSFIKDFRHLREIKKEKSDKKVKTIIDFLDKYQIVIIIILILLSGFLYLFRLDSVPQGLNVDEAGIFYDAMSLSKYGVDRYLYSFPVYLINFGGGQNALYTYLVTILFKIFDNNLFVLRLPAAIIGIISVVCTFKILKNSKNSLVGLIGAFLMLIMPFFIMKSRWGLESYLFLPFLLFSIYIFLKAIKTEKKSYFVFSGILFGLTLYTYAISYMVLPLFLGISCLYLLFTKRLKFRNLIIFAIPLAILALPLMLMLAINNGIIENEIVTKFISIPKLLYYRGSEISLANMVNNLKDGYIFKIIFSNDYLVWNTAPAYGTLYYISIPLIIYGFIITIRKSIKSIKEKEYTLDIAMLLIFLIMFIISILLANVNVNKINCIYLPLLYFATIGLYSVFKNSYKLFILILIMYLALFGKFLYYYFVTYPTEYKDYSLFVSHDFNKAVDFAKENQKDNQKIYVGGITQPYIYLLIHDKTSPYEFNKDVVIKDLVTQKYGDYIFVVDDYDDESLIYITSINNDNYNKIKELNLKEKRFNNYVVFYS